MSARVAEGFGDDEPTVPGLQGDARAEAARHLRAVVAAARSAEIDAGRLRGMIAHLAVGVLEGAPLDGAGLGRELEEYALAFELAAAAVRAAGGRLLKAAGVVGRGGDGR